jgi:hypothetical protein
MRSTTADLDVNVFNSPGFESKWNFHCQKETIDAQDAMKTSKNGGTGRISGQ